MHAWYSPTSHTLRQHPLFTSLEGGGTMESYGYLWYVVIDGKEVLATQVLENIEDRAWDDSVYLGEFDGRVERDVRANLVSLQD